MIHDFPNCTDPVAVFVDGDNLSHRHGDAILGAASAHGRITLRRVYGNMVQHKEWANDARFAAHHAASEIGKNNADIRLALDALEHGLAGRAKVFVIASNDSDFGPLAVRLRELGHLVVGIGGARPSRGFQAACTHFLRLEPEPLPETQTAVSELDALDQRVLDLIARHGQNGAISLSLLGSWLGQHGKARNHGRATWRGVLAMRCDRFILEGPKADTVVRVHPAMQEVC